MSSLLLIASGMAGGLGASLILRFVWATAASRGQTGQWRASNALNELLYVGSHAVIGGGIGLLFWLSWGFTALARFSWWQQGMAFGLANALVFGVVPLLIVRSLLRCSNLIYWLLTSEILLTCITAGLASSWSWQKAF
ncbi:MAG: hypothetical protein AB7T07_06850 [Steroidobacteraceae bacterium]